MSIIMKNAFRDSLLSASYVSQHLEKKVERPGLRTIYENIINEVAYTNATILITGESGTGKDVIAEDIHNKSNRCYKPFTPVDLSCIPNTLIESVLYGFEKGAFTGADRTHRGSFEVSNGSTIFLDEVGNISLEIQAKLLRTLQNGAFFRIGGTESIKSDFRLICATNRNLEEEVIAGNFRKDLYYRINVIPIRIPPLRETPEDIPIIADHFLKKFCKENSKEIIRYDGEIKVKMESYEWPGNVRELINMTERVALLYDKGRLDIDMIFKMGSGEEFISEEKKNIIAALKSAGGNVTKAAVILGWPRVSLHRKKKKYGIDRLKCK